MRLDIPTRKNKSVYDKTIKELKKLPDIQIISAPDDYELIAIMADGGPLKKAIDIALKSGIAE